MEISFLLEIKTQTFIYQNVPCNGADIDLALFFQNSKFFEKLAPCQKNRLFWQFANFLENHPIDAIYLEDITYQVSIRLIHSSRSYCHFSVSGQSQKCSKSAKKGFFGPKRSKHALNFSKISRNITTFDCGSIGAEIGSLRRFAVEI